MASSSTTANFASQASALGADIIDPPITAGLASQSPCSRIAHGRRDDFPDRNEPCLARLHAKSLKSATVRSTTTVGFASQRSSPKSSDAHQKNSRSGTIPRNRIKCWPRKLCKDHDGKMQRVSLAIPANGITTSPGIGYLP